MMKHLTLADEIRREMPSGWTYTRCSQIIDDIYHGARLAAREDKEFVYFTDVVKDPDAKRMIELENYSEYNAPSPFHVLVGQVYKRLTDEGFTVAMVERGEEANSFSDLIIEWI